MILLRSIIFLALTLGAVWYFLANPDRQAERAQIEQELLFEAELRDEALTTTLDNFQQAALMITHSAEAKALAVPKQEVSVNSAFVSGVVVPQSDLFEDEAIQNLQALETLTGLDAIRILRKDAAQALPAVTPPPTLVADGTWDTGVEAAFQGQIGRASYNDEYGNPVYVYFTPYFVEDTVPAIVISDAHLSAEQSRWDNSQYRLAVTDDAGKVILSNAVKIGAEIIEVGHKMPTLSATIMASAAKPPLVGPWIVRSAAATIIALLGLFLWEQRRSHRRIVSELKETRQVNATQLQQKIEEQTTELGEIKNQLATSESLAMVGHVSASIGQEIDPPLSTIKTDAEAASQFIDDGNTDLAQQNIRNISILTDRISQIVGNLHGFTSSEPYQIEPVSLRPVVHDCAVAMLDRYPSIGDYFFMEVADDVPDTAYVRADKVRLNQVIGTLLSSSWDACRDQDQPELVISIQRSADNFVIGIDHNGHSDTPIHADGGRINIGDTTSDTAAIRGPGVGFTIAKSFIESMNGQLEYKNSALGGDRMEIILPKFGNGTV